VRQRCAGVPPVEATAVLMLYSNYQNEAASFILTFPKYPTWQFGCKTSSKNYLNYEIIGKYRRKQKYYDWE
jgi:hypothetical protein